MTSFESLTQAGTALAVIISAIVQYMKTHKLEKEQVETKRVVDVTKVLVDGSLASELQISATSARTLATLSPTPEYISLAVQAEQRLKEHMSRMIEVVKET